LSTEGVASADSATLKKRKKKAGLSRLALERKLLPAGMDEAMGGTESKRAVALPKNPLRYTTHQGAAGRLSA
jgi:hypothetical protein